MNQISQQDTSREGKKAKGDLLIQLGDHIRGVISRKRQFEGDRFDYDWWNQELWAYVATLLPSPDERIMSPQGVENAYNKRKQRHMQRHRLPTTGKKVK